MKVLIMAGHTANGQLGSGAIGYINESNATRRVGPCVAKYLESMGVDVTYIQLDKPKTSKYLKEQVDLANSKGKFDVMVQIHFNAGSSDPNSATTGTETYYTSNKGKVFSDRVNAKLSTIFKNRGSKKNSGLYWLKNTNSPAILIEVCFVDDKDDARLYQNNCNEVCRLIAEGIAGKEVSAPPAQEKVPSESFQVKVINCNTLNARKGPSTNYDIVEAVPVNTKLTIVGESGNWYKTLSGLYISKKYVKKL